MFHKSSPCFAVVLAALCVLFLAKQAAAVTENISGVTPHNFDFAETSPGLDERYQFTGTVQTGSLPAASTLVIMARVGGVNIQGSLQQFPLISNEFRTIQYDFTFSGRTPANVGLSFSTTGLFSSANVSGTLVFSHHALSVPAGSPAMTAAFGAMLLVIGVWMLKRKSSARAGMTAA
jgi:hypothetical protein